MTISDVLSQPRSCARCGAEAPAAVDRCPNCQSWLAGNQGARTTGAYASRISPELAAAVQDLVTGAVSDLGGDLSTLEHSYVRKLADLEVLVRVLTADLASRGVVTPNGAKVRPSFDALMTAMATFDRYAMRLGLKRRARQVRSIAEAVAKEPSHGR